MAKMSVNTEVEHILNSMKSMDICSDEYSVAVKNLQGVCQARSLKSNMIDPEAILMAVTNILGILLILKHENVNVIATKALSLIRRF
jgi:hypothetical protein